MPILFGAGTLAQHRAMQEANMPHRATVSEMTPTATGGGGSRRSPTVVAENVPCRLGSPSGLQGVRADQLAPGNIVDVYVAIGTVIPGEARLDVSGSDIAGNDFTIALRVMSTDAPRSNATRIKVTCTPLTPASAGNLR